MRALVLAAALVGCHATPAPPAPHSDFGFYLLAMMWAPGACQLTLHGLWPNYTDEQSRGRPRAWPQYCGAYAHCEKDEAGCAPDAPVPADLAPLAPAYVKGDLATHEWSKHGSCTSLAAADYFRAELAAIRLIGSNGAAIRHDLAPSDLQRSFGVPPESVVLGCDAHCQLTQVGFCIAKDAHDHPIAAMPCSTNVTTSDYDNGCVTHACARVRIPSGSGCL